MRVFSFVFFFKIIVAFIVASFVGRCPPKKVGDAKIRDIFIRGIFIFWQIRNFFFFFFGRWTWSQRLFRYFPIMVHGEKKVVVDVGGREGGQKGGRVTTE